MELQQHPFVAELERDIIHEDPTDMRTMYLLARRGMPIECDGFSGDALLLVLTRSLYATEQEHEFGREAHVRLLRGWLDDPETLPEARHYIGLDLAAMGEPDGLDVLVEAHAELVNGGWYDHRPLEETPIPTSVFSHYRNVFYTTAYLAGQGVERALHVLPAAYFVRMGMLAVGLQQGTLTPRSTYKAIQDSYDAVLDTFDESEADTLVALKVLAKQRLNPHDTLEASLDRAAVMNAAVDVRDYEPTRRHRRAARGLSLTALTSKHQHMHLAEYEAEHRVTRGTLWDPHLIMSMWRLDGATSVGNELKKELIGSFK